MADTRLTYHDAGVDIERGNRLVDRIRPLAARTRRAGVMSSVGGFGALFELPVERYRRPVLVSGTDGVGTKLRVAIDTGILDTVGVDLVAMCANDILTLGAEPLFFLDYYATGRLDDEAAAAVIGGIARGCEQAGAALVGGETAEMPGMYSGDDFDLAGFCVGVVEHDEIIDGAGVRKGDVVLGLGSSGLHSNGFSLVRRALETTGASLDGMLGDRTLAACLLEPTRIYVRAVHAALRAAPVAAMAHITGGGLTENLPRVLPPGVGVSIDTGAWPRAAVFDWLEHGAGIAPEEMLRTFNCGIGYVLCVSPANAGAVRTALEDAGEQPYEIGEVRRVRDGDARMHFA